MKACLTLFFFYFIYLFSSCTPCSTKKIPCDAFNEPVFFKWFPYRVNDRLAFKNTNTTESFSYVIRECDTSKAYEATQGGYGNQVHSCYASVFMANENNGIPDDLFHIQYSISKEFNNGPVNKYLELYFKNTTWAVGEISESTIAAAGSGNSGATTAITEINVLFDNGITYPMVATLSNDTVAVKTERPYKIFIAKYFGIIGFEMYPSLQKWIVQ